MRVELEDGTAVRLTTAGVHRLLLTRVGASALEDEDDVRAHELWLSRGGVGRVPAGDDARERDAWLPVRPRTP